MKTAKCMLLLLIAQFACVGCSRTHDVILINGSSKTVTVKVDLYQVTLRPGEHAVEDLYMGGSVDVSVSSEGVTRARRLVGEELRRYKINDDTYLLEVGKIAADWDIVQK